MIFFLKACLRPDTTTNKKFALHYKTAQPIPNALVEKIRKSKTFNEGFSTGGYLAAAIYDMKIHLAATPDKIIDPNEFERQIMAEIGCSKEIINASLTHRIRTHLFR